MPSQDTVRYLQWGVDEVENIHVLAGVLNGMASRGVDRKPRLGLLHHCKVNTRPGRRFTRNIKYGDSVILSKLLMRSI